MPDDTKRERSELWQFGQKLPGSIIQKECIGDRWLVIFDPSGLPSPTVRRNIWCFDLEGNKLWEVSPTPFSESPYPHCWIVLWREAEKITVEHSGDNNLFLLNSDTGVVTCLDGSTLPEEPEYPIIIDGVNRTDLGPNARRVPKPGPLARLIYWLKFKYGKSHKRPPGGPEFRRKPKVK